MCKASILGRTDKKFCSASCKSTYHKRLKEHTNKATIKTDKLLHRNRSILQELVGKKENTKYITKEALDAKKFNYTYVTGYHKNSRNKIVNYIYDFSWVIFSDKVLLVKRLK